jgi:alkylation response protein AidB-like acyl-CoA dehydrogenase
MSTYRAPLRDMQFVLRELAGAEEIAKLPGYEDTTDVLDAILEEASTFASEVLAPLNQSGDQQGCTWNDGVVTTPKGFKEAYHQFAKAGWIGLPVQAEYGGQGLPQIMLGPTLEMWNAANMGFANGPLLNQGAIEAIEQFASDEHKKTYIPKLVSGEWTGTMCLTEPQAGSDLAQVRATAAPEGDHYRVKGQKIFITFGEHDMAPNIIHLVLARLPGAPEGTKGISMFIVPKVLVNADGSLGDRNDVKCAGIEHKLGINANPTCTLNYGENGDGAIGYLVGEANRGLEYMFVMMNAARFSVGVQGLAQQYRDVRITTIYEGTTGIQALDLVGRKLVRDMGASATKVLKQIGAFAKELEASDNAQVKALAQPLAAATKALGETAQFIGMSAMGDTRKAFANSVPFLNFFGIVAGGWQLFRGAKIAAEKLAAGDTDPFYTAKLDTATFYAHNVLSQSAWLQKQIVEGSGDVMAGSDDMFEVERRALVTA